MEVKLAYAIIIETKELTHAKTAMRERSWVCPHCQKPVILKRRLIRQAHFAHVGPCIGANMSALHLLCQILIKYDPKKQIRLESGQWFYYDHARIELPMGERSIDVMVERNNGARLAVEICNTSPIKPEKLQDLQSASCSALEIFVSHISLNISLDDLLYQLTEESTHRKDYIPIPCTEPEPQRSSIFDNLTPVQLLILTMSIGLAIWLLYKFIKSVLNPPKRKRRQVWTPSW